VFRTPRHHDRLVSRGRSGQRVNSRGQAGRGSREDP
jgi:hypothetical protein